MTWSYLNGGFVPADEARVPAADAGLLHARGVFETFRARRGAVYLIDRHLTRLGTGARALGIDLPAQLAGLEGVVRELTERCGLDDARVRLTLTAGPENGSPTLLIQARAATDYQARLYETGAAAVVVSVRRNETSPLSRVKTLSCLDNILAREEARRAGADEALFLNTRGLLAEGSATNIFVVREGELLTPPVSDGALLGVTRGAVLELAQEAGIAAREVSLTLAVLLAADESFLTNAVAGALPLTSVDGAAIGSGAPGEVTQRMRELYQRAAVG